MFAKSIDLIICLDQESEKIMTYDSQLVYKENSKITTKTPSDVHFFETVILDFAFSEKDK